VTEIIWSPQAIEDLQSIRRYIARDSSRFAALIAQHLVDATERLATFPESGRMVPEIGDPAIREILWRNYRIVYRIRRATVEIATVFHGAQLFRDA
jgi:toxin ParE1/3/4